jgi:hypothetical protein
MRVADEAFQSLAKSLHRGLVQKRLWEASGSWVFRRNGQSLQKSAHVTDLRFLSVLRVRGLVYDPDVSS